MTQARAKVHQIKTQLRNFRKENNPVNEYLLTTKALVNALASIGYLVPIQDHMNAIFDGLTEEYAALAMLVSTRADPISIPALESLLLTQEARLEALSKSTISDTMSSNCDTQ